MSDNAAPALELRSICVRFGGVTALDKVSLRVPARAGISSVIGPNGAGKTTLFNVITGVVKPASGQVLIAGQDMTGRQPDEIFRARISRTFQGVRLLEHLSVEANVLLAAGSAPRDADTSWWKGRGRAKILAAAALDAVGVDPRTRSRMPDQLTLLESRLVELARALTVNPIAILLDEPAAGLNTAEKERLCSLLMQLSHAKACHIVVVEHDMKLVMSIAERISVLNFGCLLSEGTPQQIRDDEAVIEAYLGTKAHHD
jgi:ABC-type branched-subunit amino acid transport system ATPase component